MSTYKEMGEDFLLRCARGDSREAFKRYAHPHFKHHNAYFKGDARTLMTAMEEAHQQSPNKVFKIHHSLHDGDLVAFHSFVKQDKMDVGYVVMHIMKFKDDQIIELWDFGQEIPKDSPNENGML
jgi:predicted SnoaL-like aldol condensation-catalyzing enzyme